MKFNGNLATAVAERPSNSQPQTFDLLQNYPNPFSARGTFGYPETRIKFQVPSVSWVQLEVLNLMGQHVTTLMQGKRPAGEYEITWDGRNDSGQPAPSGIYLLKMQAGKFSQTRKMVLAR
ncbi:T9SS type A sorting domain-containing protein [candidate division KSB1 bacterium]|nr:T9SS type A sorting domain-containing protein [candidate division KSB1 bacterium]